MNGYFIALLPVSPILISPLLRNLLLRFKKVFYNPGNLLGVKPIGASPYTYSDATGFALRNVTSPTGTWTIVQDSGAPGAMWPSISWTDLALGGTSVGVEVRSCEATRRGREARTENLYITSWELPEY